MIWNRYVPIDDSFDGFLIAAFLCSPQEMDVGLW